jgi:enoyl-CoA hydratase/carnithine racemase
MGARQLDTGADGLVAIVEDGIATLRIDRPQAKGALTAAMWSAIPALLDVLAHDTEVRVLVLRGTGGVFSAGADIRELRGHYATAESADAYHALNSTAEQALAAFPKPTIALIQGPCVGGGCQLAVACDLRFADSTARFGVTPAKLGIVYDATSTHRLARLVGVSTAKYLLFTADLIDSQQAHQAGLVEAVFGPEEAEEQVYAVAATIASRSQLTVRAAKDLLGSETIDPDRVHTWEQASRASTDVQEGLAAFTERRAPEFTWGS